MPTREELHKLIDSLLEGAMEAVQKLLTIAQVLSLCAGSTAIRFTKGVPQSEQ
jgi:hypothetical protein